MRNYAALVAAALPTAFCAVSVLQPTPPMGFNDWSAFMCGLNETLFVDTAHAMVKFGLLEAGYNRLNLDDCWSLGERAANGSMQWNPAKFPRGLPWLTSYLKSLGFQAGIYTDAGLKSCGGYPGAHGYERLDAETFASWGFDYVKLDGCNMPTGTEEEYKMVYGHWHAILSAMEPPLVFSESAPAYFAEADNLTDWYTVMDWVPEYGQLARHSRDTLVWNSTLYWPDITGWDSVMFNYGQEVRLARYQRPGYFNDPDFLNVDHFDYTLAEKKSHFAIWASLSAPLIISAYIPDFTPEEVKYLTNKDLISVNQDPLALQATLVSQDGTWDVLTKSLANGDRLVTAINRGNFTSDLKIPFERIGLPPLSIVKVKDLWTGSWSVASNKVTAVNVPSHGTAVMRLSALGHQWAVTPTGMFFNTASLTCLTSYPGETVGFANSTGADGQVWQTKSDGTISTLSGERSSPLKCLTDRGAGNVTLEVCSGRLAQQWDYHITGNVRSRKSKGCLTEGEDEMVITSPCLWEENIKVTSTLSRQKFTAHLNCNVQEDCLSPFPSVTYLESLTRDGFVLIPSILNASQIAALRTASAETIELARGGKWPSVRTLPKQFPPWDIAPGTNPAAGGIWGVQFMMHPDLPHSQTFINNYFSHEVIDVVKELLHCTDDELVLELFNLLIRPDRDFELKWHRDDIQPSATAEEEIERLREPAWHAQWNLALYDDESLIVVPGSHARARTDVERSADPYEKGLPGEIKVRMKAGDVVFYNNNILHRGAYLSGVERMTLHGSMGHVGGVD
ncbi:putative alpha-galactosidase A [Hyphodiscus hymeniophilus]|uniref:Alpha-galactosidase n=1 Tax=Hyphodiscus hymeniophilus TaxID=353542 RepID=A0A9P6VL50_9HELO|nr:putative alpha-galactosidase A [Hyphodiscus hymeniophilus]